jgi:hypothetical protein
LAFIEFVSVSVSVSKRKTQKACKIVEKKLEKDTGIPKT